MKNKIMSAVATDRRALRSPAYDFAPHDFVRPAGFFTGGKPMKLQWRFALILAGIGCLLLHSGLAAGDKKKPEPEKKKAEPAKPVVVNDEWINADLKDKVFANSFCKTYTFKMEKDKSYQLELTARNYRACLRLENSAGA